MAGDWIKVEHATLEKPEVSRTAETLGISRDAALGLFLRYFVWLDRNLSGSCPDLVRNVSMKSLDELLQCYGFSACLGAIGWGEFNEKAWTLRIINADRHHGTPAKTRALDAKRKAEIRRDSVQIVSGSKPDKNRTREEKRREEVLLPFPNGKGVNGAHAPRAPCPPCPHRLIVEAYHETLPANPHVREWHEGRQKALRARWAGRFAKGKFSTQEEGIAWFRKFFQHAAKSKFLTGQTQGRDGRPPFVASLEWLIAPSNFAKVIEGQYTDEP